MLVPTETDVVDIAAVVGGMNVGDSLAVYTGMQNIQ
jgi:hypothetical protein